ncbi:MAG: type I-C CRISPR-associated protein Cas7/Csd2 [Nitrospinaceae bacterium]
MTTLSKKIDFAVIFSVKNANPNGDPLNGNRPRTDYENFGEVSDVCIKRKIRDRLQESGKSIFVQSDEKKTDGLPSLRARAESDEHGLGKNIFKVKEGDFDAQREIIRKACEKWLDVRTFGQIFAYKGSKTGEGVSIPIRGPVSIQSAFSIEPINPTSIQITKSTSGEGDGSKKASDTMGMKHRVDKGVYVFFGGMNPQLAERTGFSDEDAETIKAVLPRLFEGDASSARPEGSMGVKKVFWWKHNCKAGQYSSAKVHQTLKVNADGTHEQESLAGLEPEIIDGF